MNLPRLHNTLLVPVELCSYAISNRLSAKLEVLIALKFHIRSGKGKLTEKDFITIGRSIGKTSRTVRNNINALVALNWIGHNKANGYYHVRSFGRIMAMCGLKSGQHCMMYEQDLKRVQAFVCGAPISYFSKQTINRSKSTKKTERNARGSSEPRLTDFTNGTPCSSRGLAQLIGTSSSTAHRMKSKARRGDFIIVNESFINTGVLWPFKRHFIASNPQVASRVQIRHNHVVIMKPDNVISKMEIKGKKLKKY